MEKERKPWWLHLNLLGLDAPLIAVMWLFLFARTWRVNYHPWEAYVALGLAVWTIRIAAKLLSAAMQGDEGSFASRHRTPLRKLATLTGILALVLTVLNLPLSGYSYTLIGVTLLAGYFALTLFSPTDGQEIAYGRHALGAVAFAYGITLMAYVYLQGLELHEPIFSFLEKILPRQVLFMFSREFICFSWLCMMALSATELWARSDKPAADGEAGSLDEIALSLPLTLLGAAALVFAVRDDSMTARPFFYAILTGAALLQVLNLYADAV